MDRLRKLERERRGLEAGIADALAHVPLDGGRVARAQALAELYGQLRENLAAERALAPELDLGLGLLGDVDRQIEYARTHCEWWRGSAVAWADAEAQFDGIAAS